jgi:transcriptional regulator with XRE-family HTH domain
MYTFPELIKKIRNESGLRQDEFAAALGVSTVLISMVETGQKEVSKNLLVRLAERMEVHPASITPFLFIEKDKPLESITSIERTFIKWGEQMQSHLIHERSKLLRQYAKR